MEDRLEQLFQMQKLCLSELQQLQFNSENFSTIMKKLTEHLNKKWNDDNNILTEFDSFITSITSIMDYGRKLNLQLHLHSIKLSRLYKMLSYHEEELCNGLLNKNDRCLYPAEEFDTNDEAVEVFEYPKLELNEFYEEGTIINVIVTYIKDINNLNFYIFDKTSQFREPIIKLSKTLDLRQYHSIPPAHEVFGYVIDQHIFRAVRCSKIFYDVEMENEIFPCYLLDTGEIVSLKTDDITYKLTHSEKEIPALALLCKLNATNKNPFINSEEIQETLKKLEFKNCRLKIVDIQNNTLYVELADICEPLKEITGEECQTNNSFNKTKKPIHTPFTEDELEILYEEPLSTSNALKAVMGHNPKDDKRICRFYNPKIGACFKGSNCKLEHTMRQPEGWTKDIIPSATIIEDLHPITVFSAGSIINITPTYIEHMDRFYAQINDPKQISSPLVWNDEDIPPWRALQKPPHMFELVLSRYIDGLWYRAKILSHDDEYKIFKVFYVDYGNHQLVHLNNLANIEHNVAQLPFKAILCRIAAVHEKPNISTEDRQKCIHMLYEMILNKSIDVEVICHYEDLFISFVSKKEYPIPDILIRMGYLESITS